MEETVDLLFFDTFAHENSEELNLDLVQFPKPVFVTEVRIIPLGARVQADFPGGVRLGATNPSQFSIEFFVNDLGKPGASTFESLGGFEYNQNGCINLECVQTESIRKVPTDGLVLRGWYTTITLAVYGILTANIAEQIIQPVVPPSLPPQTNSLSDVQQIIPVGTIKNEWNQENIQSVSVEYTQQATVAYPQTYVSTEQFPQEYTEYYGEVPKDPRSYHNTPETDWDNKSQGRTIERDRDGRDRSRDGDRYQKNIVEHDHIRIDVDRRDRHYSRPRSQDRDRQTREYSETSRDKDRGRDRDWELDRSQSFDYREHSDKDWDRDSDRNYKHQDNYRRFYGRDDKEENRKRPHTPPVNSPKRPHTPHLHSEQKELSPKAENFTDEESNMEKQNQRWDLQNQIKNTTEKLAKEISEVQLTLNEESNNIDIEEFEPILSDEDILDDSEHFQDAEYDYPSYINMEDLIKHFIPGSSSSQIQKYKKNAQFNISVDTFIVDDALKATVGIIDEFFKLSITKYKMEEFENLNIGIKEEFVNLCEKIISILEESNQFAEIVSMYYHVRDTNFSNSSDKDKEFCMQVTFITETIMDWLQIALNFKLVNSQKQLSCKIRHIKCGLHLAGLCCTNVEFIKLLWKQNYYIDDILLSLYNQEYMAISIQQLILLVLDAYLLHKNTLEAFISGHENRKSCVGNKNGGSYVKHNGYRNLIEILRLNPSIRLKFSVQSILKKINIFEVLKKLHQAVKLHYSIKESGFSYHGDVELIVNLLNRILQMYRYEAFVLSQPKRFLPVSTQFEITQSYTDNIVIKLFNMHNLLDCFSLLLTMNETNNVSSIRTPIFELLSELLLCNAGINYLVENFESVNVLLKCLLHSDEAIQYSLPYSMEYKSHTLGLKISYSLQCRYYIDYFFDVGERCKFDCDALEIIDQLHSFYCLTFSYIGKLSCSIVLGHNQNIECLMQFLDKTMQNVDKIKNSVGISYIIDLISLTIVYNTDYTFIEKNLKYFLQIINQKALFEASVALKITEFESYIKPFETIMPVTYENINPIIEIINKHLDTVTNFPGQLITCLRIIHKLGISKFEHKFPILDENSINNYVELKYKHVIIQLFSMDGVTVLTNILQKICQHYDQPSLHKSTFVSNQGVLILNIIQPCIDLLKLMLMYVIQCRNTNFKDLTTIPVLLQTYNMLRTFPVTCPTYFIVCKLCNKIIDTLLVYTQPISEQVNEKESLNKTLWTQMCGEVIKYINLAPYTFISGLSIFSELLPLPLPMQTRDMLNEKEITWAINLRKLWSAHLHPYSSNIQELINRLCISTHAPLLNLLRKVCIQLSDLAANSALMIARGVLDTIYTELMLDVEVSQPCNGNNARLLNLLACLVTHNAFKCAVLHLLRPNNSNVLKCDEKYPSLIQCFTKIIVISNNANSHVQAQECILSIIQSLCDTEITLLQNVNNKNDITSDMYLTNSLPCKENLSLFIDAMLNHLMADNSFITYLPILRTLLLLNEHDYGFYHLREQLLKHSNPFLLLLSKLVNGFSKENEDCLSIINTTMEFLRQCVIFEELSEPVFANLRTMKMSLSEVKAIIGWGLVEEDKIHPLQQLEELLKKTCEQDKTFENYFLEGVTNILNLVNKESIDTTVEYVEPILPTPVLLLVQFASRPIFTSSEIVDDQLTSAYWLSSAPADELIADTENATCDLNEIIRQHLPSDINLIRQVEKLYRIYPSANVDQDNNKTKGINLEKNKNKKAFATPVARRGFPRTVQARADLFRSRPPNTSRPPSLHVDDFVALETCGAQPTGPTGYNKISRELLATSRVSRNSRGRSFQTTDRAIPYRQMSWWNTGLGRGPYH